jgi:hypothetical protein
MLGQGPSVGLRAEFLQQLGRALDVGEQESDGSGVEVARHRRHRLTGFAEGRVVLCCLVMSWMFATCSQASQATKRTLVRSEANPAMSSAVLYLRKVDTDD